MGAVSFIFLLSISLICASPSPHLNNKALHQPHLNHKALHHPHGTHKETQQGNSHNCPSVCRCHVEHQLGGGGHRGQSSGYHGGGHQLGELVVNCSGSFLNLTMPTVFSARVNTLILDGNYFPELKSDFLNTTVDMSGLRNLSICGSSVDVINEQAFTRLTGLVELRLNFNNIKVLPSRLFEHNAKLQVLSMTNNPLIMSAVNTAYLQLLPSLRKLDLSHLVEPLVHLPESFATLTNLSEIDLRGVKFPNISAEFFSPLAEIDLVKLDLSQSEIQEVDVDAFTPLSHLSELILSKSSVTTQIVENILYGLDNSSIRILHLNEVFSHTGHNHTVTKHMFRHLNSSKLKVLHFGGNNAGLHGKLPARLFQPLKSLRELHVDNCGLLSVSVDAFHGLHHLLMLNMTKNSLTCNGENDCQFLSTGFSLKLLQTLDLSNNHITDSGHYNFSNATFPSLINLNLTKNKLQSIPTGMFGNLPKLSLLDMSENPIEEIAEHAFAELSSLATLHIENCPSLSRIKECSFNGLGGLKVLNLQNSGIVHIHHAALAHFSHLEWLYLKNNRLGESESSIDRLTLKKSVLKVLDLSDNQLNVLPMGILHNSHSLTWLIVNNNRLFNCTQFHPLFGSNITTLDASYNQFAQPTVACFEGMEKLEYLNLAGNPFVCSCELKPFTEWLVAKKIATEQNDEYVCVAPDSNSGKKMLGVSYSNWTCYGKYTMMTSLLVITLIAIFVCFTFLIVRRFRRESSNGCRMFSSCESNSSEEGTRSHNDSTPTDSCAPYSPLEEEGSPEMENTRAVQQNNPNGHRHRCADYNVVEDPECNGILFSPDRLSENGKINKNGVTRKKSRRTGEQNTPSQSRAFTCDTSSKSIRSGTGRVVDPDAMLLTSHLDNSSVDTHLEDAV